MSLCESYHVVIPLYLLFFLIKNRVMSIAYILHILGSSKGRLELTHHGTATEACTWDLNELSTGKG